MCVYCGADISIRTSGIGKCKFTDIDTLLHFIACIDH